MILPLWIAGLGAVGVLLRWAMGWMAQGLSLSARPWATVAVNLLGALLAGWVAGKPSLSPEVRTACLTGFLGGFTTFSAYCWDTSQLLDDGKPALGWLTFVGTPIVGLLLFRFSQSWARGL